MAFVPNTQSNIDRGIAIPTEEGRTSTGLSTQVIIKINGIAVGALQNLSVTQTRGLGRITEIGTDGNIEIVPNAATTFDLEVTRVVFDQLRLPEAFSRAFRFINAQRVPFDIEIFDIGNASDPESESGIAVMKYVNCWFQRYTTPYTSDNYIISETATIWAETASMATENFSVPNLRTLDTQTDKSGIETDVNQGRRRGAIDAAGIINAVFSE